MASLLSRRRAAVNLRGFRDARPRTQWPPCRPPHRPIAGPARASSGACSPGTRRHRPRPAVAPHRGPYHILVSEIMLQQTQVDRVIPSTTSSSPATRPSRRWPGRAPDDVRRLWYPLGYNVRAAQPARHRARDGRPLRRAAARRRRARSGRMRGIGRYTAGRHALLRLRPRRVPHRGHQRAPGARPRLPRAAAARAGCAGQKAMWDLAGALVPRAGAPTTTTRR